MTIKILAVMLLLPGALFGRGFHHCEPAGDLIATCDQIGCAAHIHESNLKHIDDSVSVDFDRHCQQLVVRYSGELKGDFDGMWTRRSLEFASVKDQNGKARSFRDVHLICLNDQRRTSREKCA